jgi:hypothetical protein
MSIQMARLKVNLSSISEFQGAAKRVFDAVQKKQPKEIRYTLCGLSAGCTCKGLLELEGRASHPAFRIAGRRTVPREPSLLDRGAASP